MPLQKTIECLLFNLPQSTALPITFYPSPSFFDIICLTSVVTMWCISKLLLVHSSVKWIYWYFLPDEAVVKINWDNIHKFLAQCPVHKCWINCLCNIYIIKTGTCSYFSLKQTWLSPFSDSSSPSLPSREDLNSECQIVKETGTSLQRGSTSTGGTRRPLRITLRPTSMSKETLVKVGVPILPFLRSASSALLTSALKSCIQPASWLRIPGTVGELEGFGMGLWKSWKAVPSHPTFCWLSLLGDASFPYVMPQDLCPETMQLVPLGFSDALGGPLARRN